jgi:hypothetical protein
MHAQKSKSPATKNSKSPKALTQKSPQRSPKGAIAKSPKGAPPTFKNLSKSQKSTISSQQTASSSQKSKKEAVKAPAKSKSPKSKSPKSKSPVTKMKDLKLSDDNSKSASLQLTGSAPPKKPMTGFLFFSNEKRETIMAENPQMKMTEISKYLGQAWQLLTDDQKEPYHQMATMDKIRHEKEMKEFTEKGFYINSKGENSKDIFKPKLSDDIVQPKKALSGFMFFTIENGKKLRELDPTISITDQAKQNGQVWQSLSDQQKKKYQDMAEGDKLRYKGQMDQLMTNGFFLNSEGVKSTDIAIKKRRASGDNKRKANT